MVKNLIYSASCMLFCLMIGGAVYEHIVVVPKWAAAPPVSLSMFQGEYGLNPAPFWMSIHPTILLFMITSLVMHWKTSRRKNIVITLSSYITILVITSIYFVPTLLRITETPISATVDAGLTAEAQLWETLSLVRLAILLVLAMVLIGGMAKSNEVARKGVAVKRNARKGVVTEAGEAVPA